MTNIYAIWDAGNVNRWHANKYPQLRNSNDTVHAHSARVGLLMEVLFPEYNPEYNPENALYHDLPEKALGDIPYGAPKGQEYAEAEQAWFEEHDLYFHESYQLKFCDRLDAILWALQHVPNLLRDPEWDEAYEALVKQSGDLGVFAEFSQIMDEAQNRAFTTSTT